MGKLLENSARSSSFGLARVQLQSRRTKTNSVAVGMSSSTIMVLYREKNDETFAGEILFDPTNVLRRTISVVPGRFAYGSFRPRSVRLRIESIRLRLICQFAYESDVEALNRNY